MPNTRKFLPSRPRTSDAFILSRLYSASHTSPISIHIHTRCSSSDPQALRFPCVESVLDCAAVQPHTHDVRVVLKHGRRTAHFRVFFKRHIRLPANPHLDIQGDLLVMRVASQNEDSVVNMRSGDARLSDYVVRKIAAKLRKFQGPERVRMSRRLKFERSW